MYLKHHHQCHFQLNSMISSMEYLYQLQKAFENIREQIRVDHEKTWQGINPDNSTNDSPWPKQYAVLIQ